MTQVPPPLLHVCIAEHDARKTARAYLQTKVGLRHHHKQQQQPSNPLPSTRRWAKTHRRPGVLELTQQAPQQERKDHGTKKKSRAISSTCSAAVGFSPLLGGPYTHTVRRFVLGNNNIPLLYSLTRGLVASDPLGSAAAGEKNETKRHQHRLQAKNFWCFPKTSSTPFTYFHLVNRTAPGRHYSEENGEQAWQAQQAVRVKKPKRKRNMQRANETENFDPPNFYVSRRKPKQPGVRE